MIAGAGGRPDLRCWVMEQATATTAPVHKHVQVREYVRHLLEGAAPGTPCPSERELVQRFGVARMTVRQAIDALVLAGLLERVPGRGTFVVGSPQSGPSGLTSYTEEMRRRGLSPESQTLLARRQGAGPGVARALSLAEGDPVIQWRRLRRVDGRPMCLQDAWLNEALVPDLLQSDLPVSLYDAFRERGLSPTLAEDSVSASSASAEEARLLECVAGAALLRVARRTLAGEQVIEVSRSAYRGDRYTRWIRLNSRP